MKSMGLNAVQLYVPWNFHEMDFEGTTLDFTSPSRDLVHFLELIEERDMMILLRPGPYICGEWDLGGFPARLLASPDAKLRTNDKSYMGEVTKWFNVLLPMLEPHLIQNGGGIVMVQVENEYGSFGDVTTNPDDEAYIRALVDLMRKHLGPEVILYTTDGGNYNSMKRGSLPGDVVLTLGDYGPGADFSSSLEGQAKMNPASANPAMCTEYYTGWLTHYGEDLAVTETAAMIDTLSSMISQNISFNLYMAHGGTSFGFWAGANGNGGTDYQPDITSYDYNSPISEDGRHNVGSDGLDKFQAIKDLLEEHFGPAGSEPSSPVVSTYGEVALDEASVMSLSEEMLSRDPILISTATRQEALGQRFGFTQYSFETGDCGECGITLGGIGDYANVYVDGKFSLAAFRDDGPATLTTKANQKIDILVEGMGRINFSQGIYDRKGLQTVKLDGVEVQGLEHRMVELTKADMGAIEYVRRGAEDSSARFYRGKWTAETASATYVDVSNFGKGYVFINSFNLGRFWTKKGPVLTLFVPSEVVVEGINEIIVLELEEGEEAGASVALVDKPVFL
ncbi:hypothetical protein TrCOL_g3716 [Triparma columacea]|uniref:Beta-galactosidase n=1 Tax=Triparma columacea TaxID=722753 RepID=A0A9W7GAJ4_9STRA|nr:hypothetical protein TrCOL_g3716 [Triparma columacea]